jgi:hypothetical protein
VEQEKFPKLAELVMEQVTLSVQLVTEREKYLTNTSANMGFVRCGVESHALKILDS